MRAVSRTGAIAASLLATLVLCVVASGQCTTCEAAKDQQSSPSPFAQSEGWFGPYTLGLPTGSQAPSIEGVEFSGRRTIVYISNGYADERLPVLGELAAIDGLQVVVALAGVGATQAGEAATLVGAAHVVKDPVAQIVAAMYNVGVHPMAALCAFFIDGHGTIMYRQLGNPLWMGYHDDHTARYFAEHGVVPDDTLSQTVLLKGEIAPWPPFTLRNLNGEDIGFGPGRTRVFYYGSSPEVGDGVAVFTDLEVLRQEFPDVEFVWLVRYVTDEQLAEMWKLYNRTNMGAAYPEWYNLSLDEFLAKSDASSSESLSEFVNQISARAGGWTVVYDADSALMRFWGVTAGPSIWTIGSDGTILLPFTVYPTSSTTGGAAPQGALDALREILQGASAG